MNPVPAVAGVLAHADSDERLVEETPAVAQLLTGLTAIRCRWPSVNGLKNTGQPRLWIGGY